MKSQLDILKNKMSLKLTLNSSGYTPSPLSIATSIIHAASQVSGISAASNTQLSAASNTQLSAASNAQLSAASNTQPLDQMISSSTPGQTQEIDETTSESILESSESDVTTPLLTSGEITQIFLKSCSRKNFSSLLAKELFPEDIRKTSNVNGKSGKKQLDPKTIEYIKMVTFERWPLAQAEKLDHEWGECRGAIDEGNRRLNRK